MGIILRFGLGGRDISDRFEQASVVEPVDSFQRCVVDAFQAAPGTAPVNDFGFVGAVDCLRERVVETVADAADGRDEPGLDQAPGVLD